ncbi:GntR family transcriptional regulator [soil metagenome]
MTAINRTMSDGVTAALRAAIIEGVYLPGDRLTLKELTGRFDVSATPVRTGLVNLSNEGLVTLESHRGAFVTPLSAIEIEDIFDLRARLEVLAATTAVPNLTGQEITELRDIADRMQAAEALSAIVALNNEFHMRLYEPCRRPFLLQVIRSSRLRVQQYMRWYVRDSHALDAAELEHHEMVDACQTGDVDEIGRLVDHHLRTAMSYVVEGARQVAEQADSAREPESV